MPAPTHRLRAFTLIEMLVVMAVIAVLAAILLNLNGLVQSKAARTRALGEIQTLSSGCDSYKADNGSYPQAPESSPGAKDSVTDNLDPRKDGNPNDPIYRSASKWLYRELSGDLNFNGRNEPGANPPEPKGYLSDFFTPNRLGLDPNRAVGTADYVNFIKDPYGNSYGYSTKGADAEQKFRTKVSTDPTATRTAGQGYNPTFDLWSTAGKTTYDANVWVKNW